MLIFILPKVQRIFSPTFKSSKITRLLSSITSLNSEHHQHALQCVQISLKTDGKVNHVGFIDVFPEARGTPLSHENITGPKLLHRERSSLFESPLNRTNLQSPGNNLIPISFPSRRFSIFLNPFNREKRQRLKNGEIKRFNPIHSSGNDGKKNDDEKKINKTKSGRPIKRLALADERKKRLSEVEKPQRCLKDSRPQEEARPCRPETIPSIRNGPENSRRPKFPVERRRTIAQPHPPRETRMDVTLLGKPKGKPPAPLRPPPTKCKQPSALTVETLKLTPLRSASADTRLNVESTRNQPNEACKSPSADCKNIPVDQKSCLKINSSECANDTKTKENNLSYSMKMQESSSATRNPISCSDKIEHPCKEVEVQKVLGQRKHSADKEKTDTATCEKNSTDEVILPKVKCSSGSTLNTSPSNLPLSDHCCSPNEKPKVSLSIADFDNRGPNVAIVQPHSSSETRMDVTMLVKPPTPLRPPPTKCKQPSASTVETLKLTPLRSASADTRLNVESTRNQPNGACKSPSTDFKNIPADQKSCLKIDSSECTNGTKIKENNLSYSMKMQESSSTTRNPISCSDKTEHPCKEVEVQKVSGKRRHCAEKEKTNTATCEKNSTNEFILPKVKHNPGPTSNTGPPNLTLSGNCCYPNEKPKDSISIAEFGNQRPNVAALKYRLSKCPCIDDMWNGCEKIPAIPPEPLPKPKRSSTAAKLPSRPLVIKPVSSDTGEWRKQLWYVRQRIYKCPQGQTSSKTDDSGLNPCPALIVDSVRWMASCNPNGMPKRQIASVEPRCTGKPEKPRDTKNYQIKMQEAREEGRSIRNKGSQCRKTNRGCC